MMPIRRELMRLYPGGSIRSPEWLAIRADVLQRARFKCQDCGVPDRTVLLVWRDVDAGFDRRTIDLWGYRHAPSQIATVTVYISVAHLDHDPTNNSRRNLKALCQACHLRHDRAHHWRTQWARRAIGDLLEGTSPCRAP